MRKAVEFSAYDGATALYVLATIFVVNDQSMSQVAQGRMDDIGDGTYAYSFDALPNLSYLALTSVFTDLSFTVLNPTYPASGSIRIPYTILPKTTGLTIVKAVAYTPHDGASGLNVGVKIYTVHDAGGFGVLIDDGIMSEDSGAGQSLYDYRFQADPDRSYIVRMNVYTDGSLTTIDSNYAPASEYIEPSPIEGRVSTELTLRQKIDGILALIGQTSQTDQEYDLVAHFDDGDPVDYNDKPQLYQCMFQVLGNRGATQTALDRLLYFFLSLGADVGDPVPTESMKSNIFMGAVL